MEARGRCDAVRTKLAHRTRARICKPFFQEPRNRFPASRAGSTTLFDVPARQATQAGRIDSLESIPGLLKSLQIRALMQSSGIHNNPSNSITLAVMLVSITCLFNKCIV
jgi:hypothetical protein